jgi:hypothetical protein
MGNGTQLRGLGMFARELMVMVLGIYQQALKYTYLCGQNSRRIERVSRGRLCCTQIPWL